MFSVVKNFFSGSLLASFLVLLFPTMAHAAEAASNSDAAGGNAHGGITHFGIIFAMLALVLIVGKIGNVVERYGQPAVIGELFAGILLAAVGYYGFGFINEIKTNQIIEFIAQFGALLLLFSIGLESNISDLKRVGVNAVIVAIIGVTVPFLLGAVVLAPIFFESADVNARLFMGASLVATSVGITASVFRSLGLQKTRAAQIVLGAAVIDDVLGLIVLAIVSALVSGGAVSAGLIITLTLKSFGFLIGALVLGKWLAAPISSTVSKIHTGVGMKLTLAIGAALLFGYLAELFGLEPIIGAFAAGLLLDHAHFKNFDQPQIVHDLKEMELEVKDKARIGRLIRKHQDAHVEDLVSSIGIIFIPVFFVYTGLQIDFGSLLAPSLYFAAIVISLFAIAGKMVSGIAAQGGTREKLLVGSAMVPRGEVGLIFAAVGQQLGAISQEMFSTIILVVIITTFVAPAMIKRFGTAQD